MQVLLQYQSKSYYIIGQQVYYSIGRFYYIIGQLLHYRARITVSGVYYIIGWYTLDNAANNNDHATMFRDFRTVATSTAMKTNIG